VVEDNKATITYLQLMKEDLLIMRLVPNDGQVPEFKAGQFITIGMSNPVEDNKIVRRAYSIASHPENRKYIELLLRWVRKPIPGRLTTLIFNAKVGDEISWIKPAGSALSINEKLPDGSPDKRRIICIGGGTGLAPFVSFAQHLHNVGDKREILVLHGASYVDELSNLAKLEGIHDVVDTQIILNNIDFVYRDQKSVDLLRIHLELQLRQLILRRKTLTFLHFFS